MKKLKFWKIPSLLLMGLSLFTSSMCSPDHDEPRLEVSTNEITLDAEGETQSLTIDSNVSWTITGNKSWLSVSPTMGKKDATVVLTAQQNTNVENRDCQLTIVAADGGVSQTVKVVQNGAEGELRVNGSTSASLSFGADGGEKQQINITANSDWTITSIPDWIRVSPVNGSKNSTITVTVVKENFSDEDREATLVVKGNGISANLNVNQIAKLAKNCRVELSDILIMYDGFAADLTFGSGAKGYREAFYVKSNVEKLTERDLYDSLMLKREWAGTADYTNLPGKASPETTLLYCVAAYGEEVDEKGHKYGPMTVLEITTKKETPEATMVVNITERNSTFWNVTTDRLKVENINYGQMCDHYYIFQFHEDEDVADAISRYYYYTEAVLAKAFRDAIREYPQEFFYNDPQNILVAKRSKQLLCFSWGKNYETNEFSSMLYPALGIEAEESEDPRLVYSNKVRVNDETSWNNPNRIISRSEIEELRNNMKVYKVQM